MAFFDKARHNVTTGFLLVLLIVTSVSLIGLQYMSNLKSSIEELNTAHAKHAELVSSVRSILLEQSLAMVRLQSQQSPGSQQQIRREFDRLTQNLNHMRVKLENTSLPGADAALLSKLNQLFEKIQQLRTAIVDNAINNAKAPDLAIISQEIPLESDIIHILDVVINDLNDSSENSLLENQHAYDQTQVFLLVLDVLIIAVAAIIAIVVVRRTSNIENALQQEKETAQTTLCAIADAVVSVDSEGRIFFLNPVAEQLSGWKNNEALGKPFEQVFVTIDETTRKPVDLLLNNSHVSTEIPPNRLLVNRYGFEFSIEGSISTITRGVRQKHRGSVVVLRDVTDSRVLNNQVTWQAHHDALTGLVNRREFERRLERLIQRSKSGIEQHAALYIDLDQFKIVNDTCGHEAGDKLLQELSETLLHQTDQHDTLARLGGDEFGVLVENCNEDDANALANDLLQTIQGFRFIWEGTIFKIGASIGMVILDTLSENASEVMRHMDAACYVAKDQGRNRAWLHSHDDDEINVRHGEMQQTANITLALEENRFRMYRQLIKPVADKNQAGHYELLVRMVDSNGELIAPRDFIPAAERYGSMVNIDKWVINHILERLQNSGKEYEDVSLWSINVSGQSLTDDSFLEFVLDKLDETGVDPRKLCFEVTETATIANWMRANRFITTLKKRGCQFALDDFGSGMSSFSYLKNLSIDYLKIDGAFVRNIANDNIDFSMVEAIHQVGHVMGIRTIAEFVENQNILQSLEKIGIDYAQGNSIHTPEPL